MRFATGLWQKRILNRTDGNLKHETSLLRRVFGFCFQLNGF